ncbi:MAG: DUF4177 domain-containing protein [Isosphaeraceae bacterium]
MPAVTCPSCGEKGKIPGTFIGTRIKCKKCGNAFLVTPPSSKPVVSAAPAAVSVPAAAAPSAHVAAGDGIAVEGLDDAAWSSTPVAAVEHDHDHDHDHDHELSPSFSASHPEGVKQYKLLTPKDRYFDGKFDLERLEQALNHYAREGWVVKGVATPHIAGFSGGEREQLVILLER